MTIIIVSIVSVKQGSNCVVQYLGAVPFQLSDY